MATVPPHSIVSGVDYAVATLGGVPPGDDEAAFDGVVELALTYGPAGGDVRHEQVVHGVGLVSEGGIFVHEKDDHGKDLRRWRVSRREGGGWVARQGLY
ncbi:MAG: hypothetical protein JWN08_1077 [Frankiales bacterium]|nr:hypothetical protein [Frankiales bacterium]